MSNRGVRKYTQTSFSLPQILRAMASNIFKIPQLYVQSFPGSMYDPFYESSLANDQISFICEPGVKGPVEPDPVLSDLLSKTKENVRKVFLRLPEEDYTEKHDIKLLVGASFPMLYLWVHV